MLIKHKFGQNFPSVTQPLNGSFLRLGPLSSTKKTEFPLCPPLLNTTSPICVTVEPLQTFLLFLLFHIPKNSKQSFEPEKVHCDYSSTSFGTITTAFPLCWRKDERGECLNTFCGIFKWKLVLNKKDSGKWNATRDISITAFFCFCFFLSFLILARSCHLYLFFASKLHRATLIGNEKINKLEIVVARLATTDEKLVTSGPNPIALPTPQVARSSFGINTTTQENKLLPGESSFFFHLHKL